MPNNDWDLLQDFSRALVRNANGTVSLRVSTIGPVTTSGLTMDSGFILGRSTAGVGAVEEISIGSGLTLSAGVLSASSSGGDTITSPNSTLTVGGTSTNTTLDFNLTNANTWAAQQTFTNGLSVTGATLTTGNEVSITSTSTTINNGNIVNISATGSAAVSGRTVNGLSINVDVIGGGSSTNNALNLEASNATNNYALQAIGDINISTLSAGVVLSGFLQVNPVLAQNSGNAIIINSNLNQTVTGSPLLYIASSSANSGSSVVTTGSSITVTNTGTTSTNIALQLGASGATTNYALKITAGNAWLPSTTSAKNGVIVFGGNVMMHTYDGSGTDTNVFLGLNAGNFGVTGQENIGIGYQAGMGLTSGAQNSFIGFSAGFNTQNGSNDNAFGFEALFFNVSGSNNEAFGLQALFQTTGSNNVGIGLQSLYDNTSGSGNLGIGTQAGYNSGVACPTMTNCTFLGTNSDSNLDGITNSTAIGYQAQVTASNQIVFGNTSVTAIIVYGVFFPQQATTVGAPSYVKGGMYFDTTLNKLRIGGATAWETVTSV